MNGTVTIISNRRVEKDIYLLELDAPEAAEKAQPGQFIMLRVNQGLEPLLARPFCVHNAHAGKLSVLYRVVGKGTNILTRAKAGDELGIWGPLGRGFSFEYKKPILVAGGMGIAPLNFAALKLAAMGVPSPLMCGLPGAMGFAGLVGLMTDCLGQATCAMDWATEDGSLGKPGLVTELMDPALDDCDAVLACGPVPMLAAVARACVQKGIPCQVSLEAKMACGVGACLGCAVPAVGGGYVRVCQDGPVFDATRIDWDKF